MRKRVLSIVLLLLPIGGMHVLGDDYVEDVYYWVDLDAVVPTTNIQPVYNSRAKEIVFVVDTLPTNPSDSVLDTHTAL